MWLFTKYGFFSAVSAKKRTASGFDGAPDPELMMIRARRASHLGNLKARFDTLADAEIVSKTGTDYPCRIIVPHDVWTSVCEQLSAEIDYSNFKSKVGEAMSESGYLDVLHEVWEVGSKLEE